MKFTKRKVLLFLLKTLFVFVIFAGGIEVGMTIKQIQYINKQITDKMLNRNEVVVKEIRGWDEYSDKNCVIPSTDQLFEVKENKI